MTREKAIEILRKNRPTSDPRPCGMELCDAVDMAISALRQQECVGDVNKSLTLAELRKMDGEPVWIVEYPDWGHWELSADADDYVADRDADFYGMKHNDPDGRYGLHKLGWLAYRQKPEEGTV